MRVRDVMTRNVEKVTPGDTLQAAARKMRDLDVGPLPVCDGDRLVGMVTDRDITVRATADARDPKTTPVRDCLSPDPAYGFEDEDIEEAARLMQDKQVRRLPVLTRQEQLVGIVALADVVVEAGKKDVTRTVREVSKPA